MPLTEWIGFAAASLTTASFVPQAWLTFRTRDVRGISLGMYSVFTLGVALWLAYGWLLQAWPVVAANAITASTVWARRASAGRCLGSAGSMRGTIKIVTDYYLNGMPRRRACPRQG